MGVELRLQAIPEDCELLARARQEREIADKVGRFHQYIRGAILPSERKKPEIVAFINAMQELVKANPGLDERYAYLGNRQFDAILYLLSPARRAGDYKNDRSVIHNAIYGIESLHPDVKVAWGLPIGFVPANEVRTIADFLDTVTYEHLFEHDDPALMYQAGVYKSRPYETELHRESVWEEFTDIRDLYRAAADHGEAVITVID